MNNAGYPTLRGPYRRRMKSPALVSQRWPVLAFSNNEIQPDVMSALDLNQTVPIGQDRMGGFNLSTYDARPLNCIDFASSFTEAEQAAAIGTVTGVFSFVVPQGRVAIIRHIASRLWVNGASRGANGEPLVACAMNMRIDGGSIPLVNGGATGQGVRLDGFVSSAAIDVTANIPTYIIAGPQQNVELVYTITNAFTWTFIQPLMTGQLLMASGVEITNEPATKHALPTLAVEQRRYR